MEVDFEKNIHFFADRDLYYIGKQPLLERIDGYYCERSVCIIFLFKTINKENLLTRGKQVLQLSTDNTIRAG